MNIMKKSYILLLAGLMSTPILAQAPQDTFIKIEEHKMFSQCFTTCDTNNDGIVSYAEAAAAKAADAIRKIDSEGQIYVDRAAAQAAAAAKSAEAAAKIVDVGVDPTLTVSDAAADANLG
jgi:hypothetical protein